MHEDDPNEVRRLEALRQYHVLDTLPEAAFDRITRLVKRLFQVPIVIINFVAAKRTWLKSSNGINIHEMDRQRSTCAVTIQHGRPLAVADLSGDPRFAKDPLVTYERARSYAGAPLTTPDGFHIGTLAVYDRTPRTFSEEEQQLLGDLASIIIDELELRLSTLRWRVTQERSEHLAYTDALTGLPNRLRFLDRAEWELLQARRHGTLLGVLVMDLDGFRTINDSFGHDAGDELLRVVSARLCRTLREQDTVARFGGDEFVILLPELHDATDAGSVVEKTRGALREPVRLGEHALVLSCSVGLSFYPMDGQDVTALVRAADTAMYQAKRAGHGQFRFYQAAMTHAAQETLQLRASLTRAIERGALRVHYQPQVNLRTGAVTGLEALVRWPQPDGTFIPPGRFIPLAEACGLVVPLGEWVLREACLQLARWHARGQRAWSVSVNVSAYQWEAPNFLDVVKDTLATAALPPLALVLEVTESALLKDPERVGVLADELSALGVRLSLDDYGTGCSNLSQLLHLRVRELKLDRSLVQPLANDARVRALVGTAVTLGHGLDATVVGEGVETAQQLACLTAVGCDVAQGDLLGPAMPPLEVEETYLRS